MAELVETETAEVQSPEAGKKKGLTGTAIKMIALVAMFIDHFAAIVLTDYLNKVTPEDLAPEQSQAWFSEHPGVALLNVIMGIMRLIGRFGFPLFVFLIVEGFQHTRSVKKYAMNLAIFALVSELPFNLGFRSRLLAPEYQNVFFTLLLGLLCITFIRLLAEQNRDNEKLRPLFYLAAFLAWPLLLYAVLFQSIPGYVVVIMTKLNEMQAPVFVILFLSAALISLLLFLLIGAKWDTARRNTFSGIILPLSLFGMIAELLTTDYSFVGVLTIVVMYLLRKNKTLAFSMACLTLTINNPSEVTAFLMLIPIAKYNGERGMKVNKYLFYAFYPVHIGLLYVLAFLAGFTGFALK
ncbi:MAG: conjugal transfer protein TraX [Lachnospiraceae bacterium]|nr:conjugal transfer protein TraX [Lachnospiraceae bacterium]